MISRVKQQLGGGQICITPLRTPPEGTLASAARSPIEIHSLPPMRCICATKPFSPLSSFRQTTLPRSLPPPFLPRRRNRHFTYVYIQRAATSNYRPFSVSDCVQSHDDKTDSMPTSDPRFVRAVRGALVNQ